MKENIGKFKIIEGINATEGLEFKSKKRIGRGNLYMGWGIRRNLQAGLKG